jgi:hypothetical protein
MIETGRYQEEGEEPEEGWRKKARGREREREGEESNCETKR